MRNHYLLAQRLFKLHHIDPKSLRVRHHLHDPKYFVLYVTEFSLIL